MQMILNSMQKNYGFVPPVRVEDKEFKLGQLSTEVLQPDGDWTAFLPFMEDQRLADRSDSFACTAFGTHNAYEILFKRVFGLPVNFSDRFLAIVSNITPPGADPHKVAQNLRHAGAIDEILLSNFPACKNIQEFYSPKPLPQHLIEKGLSWLNEWKPEHEWVASGEELTPDRLKWAMTLSPVCVACFAWAFDGERYFRPKGAQDTHWTAVVGYKENDYWLVFDSVEGDLKKLRWDFGFRWAKRYWIGRNNSPTPVQLSIYQKIIDAIKNIVAIFTVLVNDPKPLPPILEPIDSVPLEVPIEPPIPEPPKYEWDTPKKARHSFRTICDEVGLTVAEKNLLTAVLAAESGFDVKKVSLLNSDGKTRDWGIAQYNDYWYIGEGKPIASTEEAINNPEKCCRVFISQYKKGRLRDWVAWSSGAYKSFL